MKINRKKIIVLSLSLYLLFVLTQAPASWVDWILNHTTEGAVRMKNPQGTVWQGDGILLTRGPDSQFMSLGPFSWKIHPLALLMGRLRADVNGEGERVFLTGLVSATKNHLTIEKGSVRFPAALTHQLIPATSFFDVGGTVWLQTDRIQVTPSSIVGKAVARWEKASSQMSSVQPLGDYEVLLEAEGQEVAIQLKTLNGALELFGNGRCLLTQGGHLQVRGTAKALSQENQLRSLLALMGSGPAQGNRSWEIDQKFLQKS